jgi:hypothetical protein
LYTVIHFRPKLREFLWFSLNRNFRFFGFQVSYVFCEPGHSESRAKSRSEVLVFDSELNL